MDTFIHRRSVLSCAFIYQTLLSFSILFAQNIYKGSLIDSVSNEPIGWANIHLLGSSTNTTTDDKGSFIIHSDRDTIALKILCIGYNTKTFILHNKYNNIHVLRLTSSEVNLAELVITPSDSFAVSIIRNCINNNNNRTRINCTANYHTRTIATVSTFVHLDYPVNNDSLNKPEIKTIEILGSVNIINHKQHREIIRDRKVFNTNGFSEDKYSGDMDISLLLNSLTDDYLFGNIIGPISQRGIDNYIYRIKGETTIDGVKVFIISIKPLDEDYPGIEGEFYFESETYSLIKAEMQLNNMGLLFFTNDSDSKIELLNVVQSFKKIKDSVWLPAFCELKVNHTIRVFGTKVAKAEVDSKCLFGSYSIEGKLDPTLKRDQTSNQDNTDSLFWINNSLLTPDTTISWIGIKNGDSTRMHLVENIKSAQDSITKVEKYSGFTNTILKGGSIGTSTAIFTFPGILNVHYFDRVQGYNILYPFSINNIIQNEDQLHTFINYGFSDKIIKYNIGYKFKIFINDASSLSFAKYYQLSSLEDESTQWNKEILTWSSILLKYDYKDYYFKSGMQALSAININSYSNINLYILNERHISDYNSSNWSLFRNNWSYRLSIPIDEGRITTFRVELLFGRGSASDGRTKNILSQQPYVVIENNIFSVNNITRHFNSYVFGIDGIFSLQDRGDLSYSMKIALDDDNVPVQKVYSLPGTINYYTGNNRFRTLDYLEYCGDRIFTLFINYKFYRGLYSIIPLHLLIDLNWHLNLFYNIGYSEFHYDRDNYRTKNLLTTNYPFHEMGIRIGNIIHYITTDFAWRINHFKTGRNIYYGFMIQVPFDIVLW